MVGLWLLTLLVIRVIVTAQQSFGLTDWILGAVPLLFVYAPVWLCMYRNVDSWSYQLSIPAFRDYRSWWEAFRFNVWVNCLTWVWFAPCFHIWAIFLFGKYLGFVLPENLVIIVAYHLFFVAIPEEFFYRGYFQTRLNEIHPRKFLIFGVPMGWGAVVAALFFAFGHSLVIFQWWHFATFFPGLVFAWMRERSGGIIAGAMYHASCNVGNVCLATMYGFRSPV